MKRICALLLGLVLVVSLTACSGKNYSKIGTDGVAERAKEYGYFHYTKCDWGINPDEMFKQLGKTKADFTYQANGEGNSGVYLATLPFLEEQCETQFSFAEVVSTKDSYLNTVTIKVPSNGKSMSELQGALEKYLKTFAADYKMESNETNTQDESDKTTVTKQVNFYASKAPASVPNSLKEQYNKVVKGLYDKNVLEYKPGQANNKSDYENVDIYTQLFTTGTGANGTLSAVKLSDQVYDAADYGKFYYVTFSSVIAPALGYINVLGA